MTTQPNKPAAPDLSINQESTADFRQRLAFKRWQCLKLALLSGLGAVVAGSILTLCAFTLTGSGLWTTDLIVIVLLYMIYSGMFIMPLALIVGFPLIYILRRAANWVWLVTCVVIAVTIMLGLVIFSGVTYQGDLLPWCSVLLTYAVCYAIAAIAMRNRYLGSINLVPDL